MRNRRREVGLTAARLASVVGVTENAIRKLEAGDSAEPRFSTGMKIAAALAVSPRELADASDVGAPELAQVIRGIRAARSKIESEGASHIDVFGSVARGNAGPTSDIDVIVTPSPAAGFTLLNLVGVKEILRQQLGRNVDTLLSETIESSTFAPQIAKEIVRAF